MTYEVTEKDYTDIHQLPEERQVPILYHLAVLNGSTKSWSQFLNDYWDDKDRNRWRL